MLIYTCNGPLAANGFRMGCGARLTIEVDAVPTDGYVYDLTCEKCCTVHTARKTVPAFDILPAASAGVSVTGGT